MPRSTAAHRHTTGITRREWLQVGYSALLGTGLPSLLAGRTSGAAGPAARPPGRARTVLLIYLTGAPSHIDTFDPKPDAPAEVRGAFRAVPTSVPGVRFCEHLPRVAARAHRLAVVRTMTQGQGDHEHGSHTFLTGHDQLPPGSNNLASRHDWPCFAGGLDCVRPARGGIPTGVLLPTQIRGESSYSGQHAGMLGARHDPWLVTLDPNNPMAGVQEAALPLGLRVERLGDRRALLAQIDRQRAALSGLAQQRQFTDFQQTAAAVLTSGRLASAFALDREPDRVRERYGRHLFGQGLLLARRMVQAGVPVVQANMGPSNVWDTHIKNCYWLKSTLLPPLDQAFSALLDDLEADGLLDETLVILTGEFGRTPKLGGNVGTPFYDSDGRDHWMAAFFSVFAGAGVRGGQVIGKTDKIGAFPVTASYQPSDLGATVCAALGVDPHSLVYDQQGRPLRLNEGTPIQALYGG
jgi:hypothetical protein